jgi:hypothetical protein
MINVCQSFSTIKVTFITKRSLIKIDPTFIKIVVLPKTNYHFIKKINPANNGIGVFGNEGVLYSP